MLRYHSFYPGTARARTTTSATPVTASCCPWVKRFNPCDLYTKEPHQAGREGAQSPSTTNDPNTSGKDPVVTTGPSLFSPGRQISPCGSMAIQLVKRRGETAADRSLAAGAEGASRHQATFSSRNNPSAKSRDAMPVFRMLGNA